VPFGLARAADRGFLATREPVEIALGTSASLPLRGSIDRVDEAPDGTFLIWDYKTGGTWGHREGMGLRGGRQLQHALYALALEALLARAGRSGRVSTAGYFFPGRKGEGQRMRMVIDPEETRRIIRTLLDLLRDGAFPHTAGQEDCKFCDYEEVCGGAALARRRARGKRADAGPPALPVFREIHDGR